MFVLDTDHIIIIQRRAEPEWRTLRNRMNRYDRNDFYLSVVSIHEQLLGAHNYIARAKDRAGVVRGYQMIEAATIDYHRFKLLAFDEPSAMRFEELRSLGIRIGTMDLRIASISLSHGFTLLTRNTRDFE